MKIDQYVGYIESPIDFIEIRANDDKVWSIEFTDKRRVTERPNGIVELAITQLKEYFDGRRKNFSLPIEVAGTDFQRRVWEELIKIPYGQTLCYGDIAKKIENPRAYRAVGNANNKNRIAIVIPCHRVIGSNGKLVGYAGALWRKKWLLEHEKKNNY